MNVTILLKVGFNISKLTDKFLICNDMTCPKQLQWGKKMQRITKYM